MYFICVFQNDLTWTKRKRIGAAAKAMRTKAKKAAGMPDNPISLALQIKAIDKQVDTRKTNHTGLLKTLLKSNRTAFKHCLRKDESPRSAGFFYCRNIDRAKTMRTCSTFRLP
jgi:hypothetical protein